LTGGRQATAPRSKKASLLAMLFNQPPYRDKGIPNMEAANLVPTTIHQAGKIATGLDKLEELYAQRILKNPDAQRIANHLNSRNASKKALIAMRAAQDSPRNKQRIRRLSEFLKTELDYPGELERNALLAVIGYLVYHRTPHKLEHIPTA
jgi:hypothetical protein